MEWFENVERYLRSHWSHCSFAFSLLDAIPSGQSPKPEAVRDPEFVQRVDAMEFAAKNPYARAGLPKTSQRRTAPAAHVHSISSLRAMLVHSRIAVVVSPMCQYSARGWMPVDEWHLVHLGSRATGGAGMVMAEMTDGERETARISHGCTGLYKDEHLHGMAAHRPTSCTIAPAKPRLAFNWGTREGKPSTLARMGRQ